MNTQIIEKSKGNIHSVYHYEAEKPCTPETLIAEGLGHTIESARDTARHGVKIITGECVAIK